MLHRPRFARSWHAAIRRRLPWRALAIINIVLLLGMTIAAFPGWLDPLLNWISNIPTPLTTLAGAMIALYGVSHQTSKGFRNLIASQEHRAKIEREARQEQHDREQAAEIKKIERETKALAAPLRGELVAFMDFAFNATKSLRI